MKFTPLALTPRRFARETLQPVQSAVGKVVYPLRSHWLTLLPFFGMQAPARQQLSWALTRCRSFPLPLRRLPFMRAAASRGRSVNPASSPPRAVRRELRCRVSASKRCPSTQSPPRIQMSPNQSAVGGSVSTGRHMRNGVATTSTIEVAACFASAYTSPLEPKPSAERGSIARVLLCSEAEPPPRGGGFQRPGPGARPRSPTVRVNCAHRALRRRAVAVRHPYWVAHCWRPRKGASRA